MQEVFAITVVDEIKNDTENSDSKENDGIDDMANDKALEDEERLKETDIEDLDSLFTAEKV